MVRVCSPHTVRTLAPWALSLALHACGDDSADGSGMGQPADDAPLPAEVQAVLAEHCHECHGDPTDMFAPMSIVTWGDVQAPAPGNPNRAVFEQIEVRINDDKFPMPPISRDPLSMAELQTLNDWIAAGAPASPDAD